MIEFSKLSRRYASVWLRRLSTDRILRLRRRRKAPPLDVPLVVVGESKSALRIVALDDAAAALGLTLGTALAEARARYPLLEIAHEDATADAALLETLAEQCRRWTPLVACEPPDGIFLDITGCAHLFGGEEGLLAGLRERLTSQGFHVRLAVASTPGAAAALAHYGAEKVLSPGEERKALAPLPLSALRINAETVAALARVGLKKIADIYDLPRPPLTARFGKYLLEQLDRALGKLEEPVSPREEVPPYIAERPFAEPIGREDDILRAVADLTRRVGAMLERRGEGARHLELALFRADGAVFTVQTGTSRATHDARALAALFAERLDILRDELDPGFGYDLVRLSVLAADPVNVAQSDLAGPDNAEDLARLVDHLGARLGLSRIMRQEACDSHLPERAARHVPLYRADNSRAAWTIADAETPPTRPLRLLIPPEPVEEVVAVIPDGPPARFRWRHVLHEVARAEGPERIAAEWWRAAEPQPTRDYYRVEDKEGRRFWLFREGLFGREKGEPRWYLHGTFA
jgi:protein ImuB